MARISGESIKNVNTTLSGVYLHIPFCRSRCSYCDFATEVYQNAESVERYVDALCKEISSPKSKIQNPNAIDSIYFGGGTPSLLTAKQVDRILQTIRNQFSITSDAEITIEINPATITLETVKSYLYSGINRASFGVQTFDDKELKRLGRMHTALDARETCELLREGGFTNISFDVIAGLPGQSVADWERNLNESLKLQAEHLSLYLLEIEESTPLAKHIREGKQPLPDDDLAAEMYEMMFEKTSQAGFIQYEISSFCLPDFEGRHNSKYWTMDAVYGFGCSAHSFDGKNRRWSNERDTLKYVQMIDESSVAVVDTEIIDFASEYAFLGLRLLRGIDLVEYEARFGEDLSRKFAADIEDLLKKGLIEIDENHLKLTTRGCLFSNEVFAVFV